MLAQTDTLGENQLQTVYVTEKKPSFATVSRNITALTNSEIKEYGGQTLSDALASLPGVSQLMTGAISKPVIRGAFGNRIQVNVAGLRLEDQQWEDEHGLGLSEVGVERVELIKGPAALLFGSDAMGGVIHIIEEDWRTQGRLEQNLNLEFFSNTYGAGLDYGIKKGSDKNGFVFRTGYESHGDYSDGNNLRIPNTLFSLLNIKAAYIQQRNRRVSENRLIFSYNRFGFLTDSLNKQSNTNSPRLSRQFEGANHSVLLSMWSSKNTFHLNDQTTLTTTVGLQANHRQEQERSNRIDLNLWLYTVNLQIELERKLAGEWTWVSGLSGMLQFNENKGTRIIVPDARIGEGSLFSHLKKQQHFGENSGCFELGMRFNQRYITTLKTRSFNEPDSDVPPFNKAYPSLNGAVGQSIILQNIILKANVETGFRSGNLAELAANGLHEGTPNWYIGNPALKVEQCINTELSATWQSGLLTVRTAAFHNRYLNYIYLDPTDEDYFGFQIFRFRQHNATLCGFEAGATVEKSNTYIFSADYAFLDARLDGGAWLPYTPANRLLLNSKYFLPLRTSKNCKAFLSMGAQIVSAQNHLSANETQTPAYWLLQAGAGVQIRKTRLLLSGRNLLNKVYNDHLSRMKLYGVQDIGRNIILNFSWQF